MFKTLVAFLVLLVFIFQGIQDILSDRVSWLPSDSQLITAKGMSPKTISIALGVIQLVLVAIILYCVASESNYFLKNVALILLIAFTAYRSAILYYPPTGPMVPAILLNVSLIGGLLSLVD